MIHARPRAIRPAPTTETHPLIARLETEFGYPRLDCDAKVDAFLERPGAHCLFIPGDARRNLETADAAVILPELRQAFQGAFDCAVIDDAIEADLRERHRALKTPGLLFSARPSSSGPWKRCAIGRITLPASPTSCLCPKQPEVRTWYRRSRFPPQASAPVRSRPGRRASVHADAFGHARLRTPHPERG